MTAEVAGPAGRAATELPGSTDDPEDSDGECHDERERPGGLRTGSASRGQARSGTNTGRPACQWGRVSLTRTGWGLLAASHHQ